MLKKKIISILTLFLIVGVGYTNAGKVQMVGLQSAGSIYDTNYNITFLKDGNFLTENLGTSRSILSFNNVGTFWWTEQGQPYMYSTNYQGFFQNYYACDEITDIGRTPESANCSANAINSASNTLYKTIFKNFLATIDNEDYAFYNYLDVYNSYSSSYEKQYQIQVCFSSRQVHQTLCFAMKYCKYTGTSNVCGNAGYNNKVGDGSLINSQNINNGTFSLLPDNRIYRSPGTGIEPTTGSNTNNTNYYCPTVGQLLDMYGTAYTTGLCYIKPMIITGGSITTLPQKSIFQIFPNYEDLQQAVDLYNNSCIAPYTQEYCQNTWNSQGTTGQYAYQMVGAITKTQGVNTPNVYAFCNYSLNFDRNASTCVINPEHGNPVPINTGTTTISNGINGIIGNTYNTTLPSTNYNYGSTNTSTTNNSVFYQIINNGNSTGTGEQQQESQNRKSVLNIFDNLNEIYTKFTSIFEGRAGRQGIIPEQITRIILLILLFAIFK